MRFDFARVLLASLVLAGCARDPAEEVCPPIADGDLVVTEIGGPQTGNDLHEWVELYNASGHTIDLRGVRVRFRKVDGRSEIDILVRREVSASAGAYTVLGKADDADRDSYIDYGFAGDYTVGWLGAAAVDVEACEVKVDRARYDSLPRTGTYSLGVTPPTATANDLPANWCTDARANAGSFPGSPQKANAACP